MTDAYRLHTRAAARMTPRPRRQAHPVTVTRVDRAAWRAALVLAGGDHRRLRVRSATEIIVLNRPARAR